VVVLIVSFLTENRNVEEERESVLEPVGDYPMPVLTPASRVHDTTTAGPATTEVTGG
jgi:hypothetical protein